MTYSVAPTRRVTHEPRTQRQAGPAHVRRTHVRRAPMRRLGMRVEPLPFGPNPYTPTGLSDLAFSLKPPKFIRKAASAIKKNVTLKRVLIGAAAVVAAPFVLPVVASGAGLLARGVVSGAGLLARGAVGLVRGGTALGKDGLPLRSAGSASSLLTSLVNRKLASQDSAGAGPSSPTVPETAPATTAPTAPTAGTTDNSGAMPGGGYSGGGGGGAAPMPSTPGTDMTTPEAAGPGPGSMVLPLVIGGGLLLALAAHSKPRRKPL